MFCFLTDCHLFNHVFQKYIAIIHYAYQEAVADQNLSLRLYYNFIFHNDLAVFKERLSKVF